MISSSCLPAKAVPQRHATIETARIRHCEPSGRANARLMTGSAKQSAAGPATAQIVSAFAR
jgi:hypothetical protein